MQQVTAMMMLNQLNWNVHDGMNSAQWQLASCRTRTEGVAHEAPTCGHHTRRRVIQCQVNNHARHNHACTDKQTASQSEDHRVTSPFQATRSTSCTRPDMLARPCVTKVRCAHSEVVELQRALRALLAW